MTSKSNTPAKDAVLSFNGLAFTATESNLIREAVAYGQSGDYSESRTAHFRSVLTRYTGTERKAKAIARAAGAVALHADIVSGKVTVDRGQKSTDGSESLTAWARNRGTSQSDATALMRLGRAVSVGFSPEYENWGPASAKAGNKDVGAALLKGRDGDEVNTLVGAAIAAKAGTPRQDDGSKGGQKDDPSDSTVTEPTPVAPVDAARAAIKALDEAFKAPTMTDDQRAHLLNLMGKVAKREAAILAKSAKAVKVPA